MTRLSIALGDPLPPESLPAGVAQALLAAIERFPQGRFTHIDADGAVTGASYAETLARARGLLGGLQARGFRAGDFVVVYLADAADFVPAAWAVLLGGGVLVPLVRRERSRRHANTAAETLQRLEQVLASPWLIADTVIAAPRAVLLADLEGAPPGEPAPFAGPDDLRLLVLTSGTTTVPRLVQLTESAVLARWWPNVPAAEHAHTHLTWSPFDHIMGLGLVGPNLAHKISLAPDRFAAAPLAWLDAIERYGVTHATMTNSGLGMIMGQVEAAPDRSWDLGSLHKLGVGAEAISPRGCRRFLNGLARFGLRPDVMILGYGLSECGPVAGGIDCFTPDNAAELQAPLDRPTKGHAIRIVGEDGDVLPEGEAGAVQVRGPTMTSGYYGEPEATAALFTSDGWLRTGDLGRLFDDRVTITGREKEQIIIYGEKYACAAIEAVAERVPGVAAAYAVQCRDRRPGRQDSPHFAIFFTPAPHADDAGIAARIGEAVAADFGLAPSAVLSIDADAVPRTTSGKVRRHVLGAGLDEGWFDARLAGDLAAALPPDGFASEGERRVAAVWAEILGRRGFTAEDDFYAIGGDSIAAVRMVLALEEAFGVRLPQTILHGRATVRGLAARLEARADAGQPLLPDELEERLRLMTANWPGEAVRPGGLVRGQNRDGAGRPWFWCLQEPFVAGKLASLFGGDHPLYAMRSGLRIMDYTPEAVAGLAGRYLEEILAADPTGPYLLGGECQGSVIATEIARRLQTMGREVALLALIDTDFWTLFQSQPYPGRVACFTGVRSRFNPLRQFRHVEGWRKAVGGEVRLSVAMADHMHFWVEPALSQMTGALRSAMDWALSAPPAPSTPAPGALPDAAYEMLITAPETLALKPGGVASVPLRITNLSPVGWPADAGIGVGNHWLRASGEVAVWSDGRLHFGGDIAPGAFRACELTIRAPAEPGRYLLEFDLVEEGVTWFKAKNATTACTIVDVG